MVILDRGMNFPFIPLNKQCADMQLRATIDGQHRQDYEVSCCSIVGDCRSLFDTQVSPRQVLRYASHRRGFDWEMGRQLGSSIDTNKAVSRQPSGLF